MGSGGVIPRPLKIAWALVAAITLSGCIEVVEPNIPSLGAPAVLSVTVRMLNAEEIEVSGSLSSGREVSGERRLVGTPLTVLGIDVPLGTANAQGTFIFNEQIPKPSADFVGPIVIQGPAVSGVAPPPQISWYGFRRLDPDTVRPNAMGDVELHVETQFGEIQPPNRFSQWFLELRGDASSIRVSGDGPPPPVLRIPSQFIPEALDRQVEITLIYFQSATLVPQPGDYISSVTLDARTLWILRLP